MTHSLDLVQEDPQPPNVWTKPQTDQFIWISNLIKWQDLMSFPGLPGINCFLRSLHLSGSTTSSTQRPSRYTCDRTAQQSFQWCYAKTNTPRVRQVHHPTLCLVAKTNLGKYLWCLIASFWLNLTLRHFQTHAGMILFILKTPSSLNAAEERILSKGSDLVR